MNYGAECPQGRVRLGVHGSPGQHSGVPTASGCGRKSIPCAASWRPSAPSWPSCSDNSPRRARISPTPPSRPPPTLSGLASPQLPGRERRKPGGQATGTHRAATGSVLARDVRFAGQRLSPGRLPSCGRDLLLSEWPRHRVSCFRAGQYTLSKIDPNRVADVFINGRGQSSTACCGAILSRPIAAPIAGAPWSSILRPWPGAAGSGTRGPGGRSPWVAHAIAIHPPPASVP